MKTILTRLFTVMLLIMVSMGAMADVKVLFGEKGESTFKSDGGTIEVKQETSKEDATKVTVYLTVTPNKGYTMQEKNVIEAYATAPANIGKTRAPEVSEKITFDCDGFKDEYSARTYYVDIDSKLALWVKSADFQKKEDGSKGNRSIVPFDITTTDDITNHTEKLYWIESAGATGFYAVPHSNNTNASTTNAPTLRALWYFMESGESGYYYIINKETGTYLKKTGNVGADNTIGVAIYANADDSKFKFSFDSPQGITQGCWVIYPKEAGTTGWLSKKSGNAQYDLWLKVGNWNSTPVGDLNSQWKIVARADVQWPQSGLPFVVSTSNEKHYYHINHAQNTNYNISYDGSNNGTISNAYDNKTAWYFEEAAADPNIDNLKYYNIVNAQTGQYLKFTATTIDGTNQTSTSVFTLSDYSAGDADRFQFVVVNSYGGNAGYSIMPKLAMSKYDVNNYANSMMPSGMSNNKTLKLSKDRNDNNAHWNFVPTEYPMPCVITSITYSSSTGKITITRSPSNAEIHYTLDGITEPTSSSGTSYSSPFGVSSSVTIKAIATKDGYIDSEVATVTFNQVATPTIQNNGSNAVSITCATEGATIYYTTDGNDPTTSSTTYTVPLTENVSGVTIKAIAVKDGLVNSVVGSGTVTLQCAKPIFTRSGASLTITCNFPSTGVSIYYTMDGSEPSSSSTPYTVPISVELNDVIKAISIASGYVNSPVATKTIHNDLTPTDDNKYLINSQSEFETFLDMVNEESGAGYHYVLKCNVSASSPISQPFTGIFEADADANGNYYKISGLTHALFNTVDGGTVKNVMLDDVSISSGTSFTVSGDDKTAIGAIACVAKGTTRIYNCGILATTSSVETNDDGYTEITTCSSSVGGTADYVGGLVGFLDGSSRVINCFSYADITGGNKVGGIVGWNNVATTSTNLQTMVMNCMFYGDITGGTSKAPIYNGEIITNDGDADGVNNFNYFWAGASYVQDQKIDTEKYNCALSAETRYLQRFEFFRHLLNSNRELAAWWASSTTAVTKDEMAKWVMEPSQIGTATPYPILKTPGKYYSVVNYTQGEDVYDETLKLTSEGEGGVLHVTIQMGDGDVYDRPFKGTSNAAIINTNSTSLDLPITKNDPDHFNFNYGKVQLPYYNDVGTKNYTDNKVVTGWKIVSISDGTTNYSTDNDNVPTTPADAEVSVGDDGKITFVKTPYNFADRNCTGKDDYDVSGRVFSQGAYWDVPEDVTAITIEPYWGKAVYLSDAYWDVTYKNGTGTDKTKAGSTVDAMTTAVDVTNVGGGRHYEGGVSEFNGQLVYTSMGSAIASSGSALFSGVDANNHTVYDYAVVLVGNYHHNGSLEASNSKPYTVTSVDLDGDNEPDYSYILRFNGRMRVHPVRIDFLNAIGLGMAQKSAGGTGTYNFGIMQPKGWFESTNTATFRMTQFEYDYDGRTESPMILQGGVIEQWVTVGGSEESITEAKSVSYYHVGGNVWFKEFHIGVHQDKTQNQFYSPHPPISVTGGDFDEFYLTGLYNTPNENSDDNAECYINGGRFGKVAGTGMQGIGGIEKDNQGNKIGYSNGDIIWQIDNADIDEFYAGGINAAHIAEGNIYTVITNSRVDQFCGGPKFGNMNSDKKVVTNAENCTFRAFFGAGYGGNSYNRRYPSNKNNVVNLSNPTWNTWVSQEHKYRYNSTYKGVETRIDYQFLPMSSNILNVARLFVDHISFSLATTHDVTSKLTGCTITKAKLGKLDISDNDKRLGNFFGGGSLGKVAGPVKSTLTNCTVEGNVFGAGYSASVPTVSVMNQAFQTEPRYDANLGAYMEAKLPTTVTYTWQHRNESIADAADDAARTDLAIDKTNHILYTNENLSKSNLGSVSGAVTLTITGNSTIGIASDANSGNVYGGGDESYVTGSGNKVIVTLSGNTQVLGNVYGGGNKGVVEGRTEVNIKP